MILNDFVSDALEVGCGSWSCPGYDYLGLSEASRNGTQGVLRQPKLVSFVITYR